MKKWILIVLVLLASFAAFKSIQAKKQNALKSTPAPVQKGPHIQAVYGLGTVTAHRTYQLKVAIPSQLTALYVKEGQEVVKGQKLLSAEIEFRAPFSGTITSIPYKVGEIVFPQTTILSLTDLTDRYVVVSLEQESALLVKKGQEVVVSFENMRDKKFIGHVTSVFSNENQFLVHVEGVSFPKNILPGMTCDVAIVISKLTP